MKALTKNNLFIGSDSLTNLNAFLTSNKYSRIIVITDENAFKYCYPILTNTIGTYECIQVRSGEENKTPATCVSVWKELSEKNIDRKAMILNLGGGIVCDMGGFIASSYKRGIEFIHIPTTLLAMCDASIGGKLGINLDGLKNYVGIFKNPTATAIYPNFLKTLPDNELISGYAEIIKHAIISDKRFFNELCETDNFREDTEKLIIRSVRIKSRIVNLDLFEKGIRKSLNFGHTIGHALESHSIIKNKENTITHGEAVAAGLITESHISMKKNFLDEKELKQIIQLINRFFKKITINENHYSDIISLMSKDKKNEDAFMLFTLLDGIGQFRINEKVSEGEIRNALKFYKDL